jgi:very-short-patch-repair endonuclease
MTHKRSELELLMESQMEGAGIEGWSAEHEIHPDRKWRVDFLFPDCGLALEIEGGTHVQGRHQTAKGFQSDVVKYNFAALSGLHVLRATGDDVRNGTALAWVQAGLRKWRKTI